LSANLLSLDTLAQGGKNDGSFLPPETFPQGPSLLLSTLGESRLVPQESAQQADSRSRRGLS